MTTSGQEPSERTDKVGRAPGTTPSRSDAGSAREKAAEAAQNVQQRGKARIEEAKDKAARQVGDLAGAVDEAASRLAERNSSLADQAGDLAVRLERLADRLRSRSLDELAADAQAFARQNPALFLLGSAALGLALSRFLKASGERREGPQVRSTDSGVSAGDAGAVTGAAPAAAEPGPMETLNIPEGI